MSHPVGIDLGTTNTVVAAVIDGVATTLAGPDGDRLLPSVVSFHPSGSVLVGRQALDRRLNDAPNTIYSVKRLIGRPWESPEVQEARNIFPFDLREGPKGGTVIRARGEEFSLPEISAFVLRQAKSLAESVLGGHVDRAVVTVPANFNDLQRAATKMAGHLAGFDVLRILNEPTAAALAYGQPEVDRERVAVYDLGGGTFDISILDLLDNVFEVRATAGDSALGGDDIDVIVAEKMLADLLQKHRFDARTMPAGFTRLRILAEHLKCALSLEEKHTLAIDDFVPGDRGATVTWSFRMTRPEREWAAVPVVERTLGVCQRAFEAAGVSPSQVDRVVLVGGATRMPLVVRKAEQFFGRTPTVQINPDEVVALGAAIQADQLDRSARRSSRPSLHPRIAEQSVLFPPPQAIPSFDALPTEELPVLPIIDSSPPLPIIDASPSSAPPPLPPLPLAAEPPAFELEAPRSSRRPSELGTADTVRMEVPALPPLPAARRRTLSKAPAAGPPPLPSPRPPSVRPPSIRPPLPVSTRQTAAAARSVARGASRPSMGPKSAKVRNERAHLLIDVTSLSLSVETAGGFCDFILEANTPIPCDRTRSFTTAQNGQTSVRVRVAQGEGKRFSDNTMLGEVELSGMPPAPRGAVIIEVTFEIDADGMLNVRARDTRTGKETAARIQLIGMQLDPVDLEKMKARQEAHPLAAPAPATTPRAKR